MELTERNGIATTLCLPPTLPLYFLPSSFILNYQNTGSVPTFIASEDQWKSQEKTVSSENFGVRFLDQRDWYMKAHMNSKPFEKNTCTHPFITSTLKLQSGTEVHLWIVFVLLVFWKVIMTAVGLSPIEQV